MSQEYIKKDLPTRVGWWGIGLIIVGVVLSALATHVDKSRSIHNYLVMYMMLVSIAVGTLFWIAIEHLTGAIWSAPIRRVKEIIAGLTPVLLIAVIPLLVFGLHDLYHWTHAEAVANDAILSGKASYLNIPFFTVRSIACIVIWIAFYLAFSISSRRQDTTGDQEISRRNVAVAAAFLPLFAVSITLASVDWMMSLEPHWFSTIYGIYYFGGSVQVAMAVITICVVMLREKGYLHPKMTRWTYYSMGCYLFGFTVFWAYIAFCQYLLIWYANMPEETFWFLNRWNGNWKFISISLIFIHFVIPFFGLLSRPAKMNPSRLLFFSVWIIIVHLIDLYFLIMPTPFKNGFYFGWTDAGFPILATGIVVSVFYFKARRGNLVPVSDPKLERGLAFRM